ncbi:YraN family protein [Bdellovibrionota bacterium]
MSKRKELGKKGELIARRYLQSLGYKREAENVRTRMGEIDLIAWDGGELVFVEVKTSKSNLFSRPEELYSFRQRQRLRKIAEQYLCSAPKKSYSAVRFDFIGVTFAQSDHKVVHLKNVEL